VADGRAAEVIVVGGGPAGSATACFLARAGVDVIVLDRAHFPRAKPCSEFMSPEASRLLDAMGALGAVEAAGAAQLTGMRVRAPSGAVFDGRFAAGHGYRGYRDRGFALPRTVLDAILLDRARAAGARVVEGAAVTALVRDARGRVAGVHTREGGRERERPARVVVGADGLRSVVARRAGLDARRAWPRRLAMVTHMRGVEGMGATGEMFVERDAYAALADVGNGLTNVAVVVPARRGAELGGDAGGFMRRWLMAHPIIGPRLGRAEQATPLGVTGPFATHARRGWAPGLALVGDAADFFDPFTGEGIFAALRGGELLAPWVQRAVAAPSVREADRALASYDAARRRAFRGKWMVERLVGLAVGAPALMDHAARSLARRRDLADLLVGVTGDFVPPAEVLHPRFLLQLLVPGFARP
jgi:flavin-dependent dehydrogenase